MLMSHMLKMQHPLAVIISTGCFIVITTFGSKSELLSISFLLTVLSQGALLLGIHRLTLHPLAAYPGPWYAAIGEAYNVYCCLMGDRHLQFKTWHDYYGPALRYAPNRLSFCDEGAINDIYGVRANVKKSSIFAGFNHIFGASASFTEMDRNFHAFKRKTVNQAFQPAQLEGYAGVVLDNLDILTTEVLSDIRKDWTGPYDLSQVMNYLFADITTDIIFSNRWNVQTSSEKRWILHMLPLGSGGLHAAGHIVAIVKLGLAWLVIPKIMLDVQRFLGIAQAQCKERIMKKENARQRRDVFSSIMSESALDKDPQTSKKYRFTMNDLVAEAGFLMIAGGDTTATTVTATLFYLLSNPTILNEVRKEVGVVFSKGVELSQSEGSAYFSEKVNDCRLLHACIEETLRLTPPVGGISPREVLPGGLQIADKWIIPAGCDVGVPVYAMHHNEEFWSNANNFEPKRWLSDGTRDRHNTFLPFGSGRASCLGKQLAYIEVALVVARMLLKYEFNVLPLSQKKGASATVDKSTGEWGRGNPDEFQARDVFTSEHVGPMISLRLRE